MKKKCSNTILRVSFQILVDVVIGSTFKKLAGVKFSVFLAGRTNLSAQQQEEQVEEMQATSATRPSSEG